MARREAPLGSLPRGLGGDALDLPGNLAPEEGYEIVPGDEAKALVRYILGLRRAEELPASITGAEPKVETK